MASLASIISLIALLATYGYSLPIEDQFQSSTSSYEFPGSQTIFDTTHTITARLMNEEESASVPTVKVVRGFSGQDSFEYTTPAQSESHEDRTRELRMNDDGLFTSSPFTYTSETPSSDLRSRGFVQNDILDTTTFGAFSAEENRSQRGIKGPRPPILFPRRTLAGKDSDMDKSTSAEVFSTTPVSDDGSVPSTSADSFGKFTGRRTTDQPEETSTRMEELTTTEPQEDDHSGDKTKFTGPSITKDQKTDITVRYPNKVIQTHTITKSKMQSASKKDSKEDETEIESKEHLFADQHHDNGNESRFGETL